MENASKALIIVGSILITLMVIAVGVYIFRVGRNAAGTTAEASMSDEVSDFNAKFSIYSTSEDENYKIYNETTRMEATTKLKNISEVVTAINLAYDVNYENNYGYKYASLRGVETRKCGRNYS